MLLTVKLAAERLGVSPALVYALCARGEIRHERHGLGRGVIRIAEQALDDYRRGREVVPKATDRAAQPRRVKLKHLRL
jgi:excisionase family DNA binding protein